MQVYDVIVVGSGAAGLTAATVAACEGRNVLLVEATSLVGGTTAISGGMMWLPGHPKQTQDGIEAARLYLRSVALSETPVREAFLLHAGEAVRYLEEKARLRLQAVAIYPDYYPDLPGAVSSGRVLEAAPFDGSELGPNFCSLRPPMPELTLFNGMMVSRADLPSFRRVFRSLKPTLRVARLIASYAIQRLRHTRGTTLFLGNALAGRLYKAALDAGVEVMLDTAVTALVREGERVAGVKLSRSRGEPMEVRARQGIILATGGFSHDAALRAEHLPPAAQATSAAIASGATSGVRLAGEVGGVLDTAAENRAFWVPGSPFVRTDGSKGVFPHTVTDRTKPGLIAVDSTGCRFVNEAQSYHEFVLAMLRRANNAVPAYLLCDRRFLWKYGLGRIKPFQVSVRADLASGYLMQARSIAGLAEAIGVPAGALEETVARYNEGARRGEDPEFGRGGDIYQRHLGDPSNKPNPCIAPILKPPFSAIAVYPADLGTAIGLRTDPQTRALDAKGNVIAGLFACGNDMNSIMAGAYPGPGITLGPALTFGYIAGRSVAAEVRR